MTNAQHTPGPWNALNDVSTWAVGAEYIDPEDGEQYFGHICEVPAGEANARLIAAAPDLLAALIELGRFISEPDDTTHPMNKALAQAQAAVRKAEGK